MEEAKNMAFNEEMSERVDRFLRKEMSEKESAAFTEEVKTNPELREYYIRQFNLMRGIQFQNLSELMKKKEAELSTNRRIVSRPFVTALSTFAVAAAMVCGVFIWDDSRTRSVGSNALESVVWKGQDSIETLIRDGKYEEALAEIDKELEFDYQIGDDPEARAAHEEAMNELKYQKALIYLAMGKKSKAKAIINELNDVKYKGILKELLW